MKEIVNIIKRYDCDYIYGFSNFTPNDTLENQKRELRDSMFHGKLKGTHGFDISRRPEHNMSGQFIFSVSTSEEYWEGIRICKSQNYEIIVEAFEQYMNTHGVRKEKPQRFLNEIQSYNYMQYEIISDIDVYSSYQQNISILAEPYLYSVGFENRIAFSLHREKEKGEKGFYVRIHIKDSNIAEKLGVKEWIETSRFDFSEITTEWLRVADKLKEYIY